MTTAMRLRKQKIEETGSKFSLNDVIIKAAALALRAVPEVNTTYSSGAAAVSPTVDISVAVASPRGLITPIVTRSDARSVLDIAQTIQVEEQEGGRGGGGGGKNDEEEDDEEEGDEDEHRRRR